MKKRKNGTEAGIYIRKDDHMIHNLMTIDELCERLSIGKNSAYKLAKKMRSIKIGRKLMVPKADVDHYVLSLIKQREERMKEREKNFQKMRE